jgi:nucleoside-diphosphate-sugar epimerase
VSKTTGPLEPTNQWYAVAKIGGIKLVEAFRQQYGADFISVMPTNLYGPGDNYHPEHSHVPAALIRRLHEAKLAGAPTVTIWGTGRPQEHPFVHRLRRQFGIDAGGAQEEEDVRPDRAGCPGSGSQAPATC